MNIEFLYFFMIFLYRFLFKLNYGIPHIYSHLSKFFIIEAHDFYAVRRKMHYVLLASRKA